MTVLENVLSWQAETKAAPIKKHFEQMASGSKKKVAPTAPKLTPEPIPKVQERPLEAYEMHLCQEVI